MRELSITPSVTVTIGRHTRLYFAFVTTAPVELDSPGTMTLHAAPFADVAALAADPITLDELTDEHQRASSSSTRWSWPGNAPNTADTSTCSSVRIPGSSDSTRCSTGCGNACGHRSRTRRLHEPLSPFVVVNRSPQWRAFLEVTP